MEIKNVLFHPWKELKSLQDKKLHHFITRQIYPFSPYYRELFDKNKINPEKIRCAKDLQRIPFTSKEVFSNVSSETIRKRALEFILQPSEELIKKFLPKRELAKIFLSGILREKGHIKERLENEYRPIFLTATAGTTGEPVAFLYTSYDLENLKIYGKRIIDIFGIKREHGALNCFPYAPHLAFWQTVFAGISSGLFILSTGGGKTIGTEGNLRSILKVRPSFLIGMPSYVYHLLKTAREENQNLCFIRGIALGAARVPLGFKRKIAALLSEMGASNINVLGTYGFTEARSAWAECPTDIEISSGYHTYPDKEIFEIIDPDTGEIKREGEDGEIVYTPLDARGTCVLRYRTGDLVKGGIIYSPCPHCGRRVPRLSSDIVRASNIKDVQLSKIKGSLINLNILEHLLDNKEEVGEWQIEIRKKNNDQYEVDELVLYLCLLRDVDKERFIKELNEEVLSKIEVSFNEIHFLSRKEILHRIEIESAVKAKRVVDRRKESS